MSIANPQVIFRREYEPLPGTRLTTAVQFHGTGNLTSGTVDQLYVDKTSRNYRRWAYYKCKKRIPDLCTNLYGNKVLIERIEKAALATTQGLQNASEEMFLSAMKETEIQFNNPRSDSAEALDRLGEISFRRELTSRAITCFEYSLHMRRLLYGKDAKNVHILRSLVYLGNAWAQYHNSHRAIIVFERALEVAKSLCQSQNSPNHQSKVAEILHNLGTCWERLHEHHSALYHYEKAEKIRRTLTRPEACVGANVKPVSFIQ